MATIPFEALAAQLGEYEPVDTDRLVDRITAGRRGGYCFEVNGILAELLETCGFTVERHEAIVGARDAYRRGELTNHLALVVHTPDGPFIAEAGFGDGPVDPLPLAEGVTASGPSAFEIAREGAGWWVGQGESPAPVGFRFADEVVGMEAFAPHHERTATSPESGFVRTLVLIRLRGDQFAILRARTLRHGGSERVLADADDLATVLRDTFGIDTAVLGKQRLARLWELAVAQHEAHVSIG